MSAIPIRKPSTDDAVGLLREILAEVRGLRADLRKRSEAAAPALVDALAEYFGPGRFTVAGLLALASEPGAIADALAEVIDLGAAPRSRATQLGALLTRMPEVEVVAQQRGCSVYRLRTSA